MINPNVDTTELRAYIKFHIGGVLRVSDVSWTGICSLQIDPWQFKLFVFLRNYFTLFFKNTGNQNKKTKKIEEDILGWTSPNFHELLAPISHGGLDSNNPRYHWLATRPYNSWPMLATLPGILWSKSFFGNMNITRYNLCNLYLFLIFM